MKHFCCVSFVLVAFVGFLQSAEVPKFIALRGHRIVDDSVAHYVGSIAFSPDGKKVVTYGMDGTVRIWDAGSGKELHKWESRGYLVAFSLDGKKLL